LKDDPGQCKLDEITEEIKLYRRLFDKDMGDLHICSDFEKKKLSGEGRD